MRMLLVCTSFCLVAFSTFGDPGFGAGTAGADTASAIAIKGDMQAKDQSRLLPQQAAYVPVLDWPILLRDDLSHLALGDGQADPDQEEDNSASAAVDTSPGRSADDLCAVLADAAQSNHLPVKFLLRLIWQESRFDPYAVSHAGAQGVAQFMPDSAAEVGLNDPFDPLQALPASARLLSNLKARFGNLGLAAAAYNAGPKRIQDWLARRGRLPSETRDYVLKVTGRAPELWKRSVEGSLDLRIPAHAPCRDVVTSAQVRVPAPNVKVAHRGRHFIRLASTANDSEEPHRRRRR